MCIYCIPFTTHLKLPAHSCQIKPHSIPLSFCLIIELLSTLLLNVRDRDSTMLLSGIQEVCVHLERELDTPRGRRGRNTNRNHIRLTLAQKEKARVSVSVPLSRIECRGSISLSGRRPTWRKDEGFVRSIGGWKKWWYLSPVLHVSRDWSLCCPTPQHEGLITELLAELIGFVTLWWLKYVINFGFKIRYAYIGLER